MSLISDLHARDKMAGISFSDRASIMSLNWARAQIAYASHCDTFDGVALGGDIDNLAAVASIVAEADNVWHG
jgi:hypothetical protein